MMPTATDNRRLIESDEFPFEFLSRLAERESWRKEVHRPIYHVHKWWAKRLGSVFRGVLLGCVLGPEDELEQEFYRARPDSDLTVFDPFMGSGTTVGEAHKLGFTAIGRDINPVAAEAVVTALGPLDRQSILRSFQELSAGVGERVRALYETTDSKGRPGEVLYYFWVMQSDCPSCRRSVDLFPSYVIARNAYPDRKPEVRLVCPACGDIFSGLHGSTTETCHTCACTFNPERGAAHGAKATCPHCQDEFTILQSVAQSGGRPRFRLYARLVLTRDGSKEYLPASPDDQAAYERCSNQLTREVANRAIRLPDLALEQGHNTRQAIRYGFRNWRDFFNDRQLLALGWLRNAIEETPDAAARRALLTLFSGVLEFNNLFASYKGEGTGAVRHMFSHHILKPERTPIEANIWGTPKSSGSFSNLFRGRLLKAIDYRETPTEVSGRSGPGRLCASAFSGCVEQDWPTNGRFVPRGIYLSCGDSANTGLPERSVDLVVTDPPFFDNVHYSELADFFFAWHRLSRQSAIAGNASTRNQGEVQDANAAEFSRKLAGVFRECHRVLKVDGLLAFTYHHSRDAGWTSLARALLEAGFLVTNSQPVKSELSNATPKSQTKYPIQLDIVIVCRKRESALMARRSQPTVPDAVVVSAAKVQRLQNAGLALSRNDRKIVLYGQLLTTICDPMKVDQIVDQLDVGMASLPADQPIRPRRSAQRLLFEGR